MFHSDTPTEVLIAAYSAGESLRAIGKRYVMSHTAVADRLDEAGIPRRLAGPHWTMRVCSCGVSFRPKEPRQVRCSENCKPAQHAALCKRGLHPLIPENLTPARGPSGSQCRRCLYEAQAQYRARKKVQHGNK